MFTILSRVLLRGSACMVALLIATHAARAGSTLAPPATTPTSVQLSDVLALAHKADGTVKPPASRVEHGLDSAWGMKGSYSLLDSGDDYRYSYDLSKLRWDGGQTGGQGWQRDENGQVTLLHDTSASDFAPAAGYLGYPASELKLLGESADGAYVVQVDHPYSHRRWLFFDKKTGLLVRQEVGYPDARRTFTYSDFRKTDGCVDAWHVHATTGVTQNDYDLVTTSIRYGAAVGTGALAIPSSDYSLVQFPSGSNVVALPSRMVSKSGSTKYYTVDNPNKDIDMPGDMSSVYSVQTRADPHILVQLTIQGKGYDFYLDSGASGVFIDSSLAAKLGLETFGPSEQNQFGQWVKGYALLPEVSVGGITVKNLIAATLPGWDASQPGVDIVGLVGYDFIANAVLAIDYEKGTVTATNPLTFEPPADGVALPIALDDGVPYITVQIGQTQADRFVVDTGSPNCFLAAGFAKAHPEDIKDQGVGGGVDRIWLPYYGFSGVGGDVSVRATEVKTLAISGVSLSEWIMFQDINDDGSDLWYDGLIGADFLKYFTVYLDYPQNEIFLVPNALGRAKAGA